MQGEFFDADGAPRMGNLKKALQLDAYYATMVRGSCVKIPLTPDIWCPHDELQHAEVETQNFFRVMWKVFSLSLSISALHIGESPLLEGEGHRTLNSCACRASTRSQGSGTARLPSGHPPSIPTPAAGEPAGEQQKRLIATRTTMTTGVAAP